MRGKIIRICNLVPGRYVIFLWEKKQVDSKRHLLASSCFAAVHSAYSKQQKRRNMHIGGGYATNSWERADLAWYVQTICVPTTCMGLASPLVK